VADRTFRAGVRLALTTFTVAPVRAGRVDRATAGAAMTLAPAVGALLGALLAAAGLGLRAAGATPYLAAAVAIGLGVALTRGLHIDGLADTADGLGSYRDAASALAIMKKPDVGPFGVAAIVVVLLVQVAGAAAVLGRPWPSALAAVVVATATGRLGATLACRGGVPAAREEGLGALVAGTVRGPWLALVAVSVAFVAAFAVPGRPWQGPLGVALGLAAVLLLVGHTVRRLGGITGDVLGAAIELATCTAYLTLAL
jgi:cobalamin 5'-phosphate synthase/cobalamin synthase